MKKYSIALTVFYIISIQNAFAVDAWSEKFKIRLVETSVNSKQVTIWPRSSSVEVNGSACTPRTYFRFNESSAGVLGYDNMVAQLLIASSAGLDVRFYGQCDDSLPQHTVRVIQVTYN